MNINQISPYVRFAAHSVLYGGFYIKSRILFDYELVYIEYGNFKLIYDGTAYDIKKGDILLIPPEISHCFDGTGYADISQPHIHFDMVYDLNSEAVEICFRDINAIPPEERRLIRKNIFPRKTSPFLNVSDKNRFLRKFYGVINAYEEHKEYYQLECKSKMTELIAEILKAEELTDFKSAERNNIISNLKNYIDENYKENITLEKLEKQFNYNKYYLLRKFKEKYGASVIEYSNNLKLECAKKMLLDNYTVNEIAENLSFSSIYSFSRFFSSREGISPLNYRKQNKELPH